MSPSDDNKANSENPDIDKTKKREEIQKFINQRDSENGSSKKKKLKFGKKKEKPDKKDIQKQKEEERLKNLEVRRKEEEKRRKEKEETFKKQEEERAQILKQQKEEDERRKKEQEALMKQREEERQKALKIKEEEAEKKRKEREILEKQREKERTERFEAKRKALEEKRKVKMEAKKKKLEKKKQKDQEKQEEKKMSEQKTIAQKQTEFQKVEKSVHFNNIKVEKPKSSDIVEKKTGFGWKGLGSRFIYFNNDLKEYHYEISEPILNPQEMQIKDRLIHLFRVRADIDVFETDIKLKLKFLEDALNKIIKEDHIELSEVSKNKIFYYIFQDFVGYGKIDILMNDEGIEDISCDGHDIPIYIYHKLYESIRSNVLFTNEDTLNSFVVKLSQMCGKQISVYEPVVDGKLEDGSRLQVTLANTITKKSTFTIRRFREDPLTPVDLIANNTMSVEMAAYFWLVIEHGASVLFCGGTASGKTTMLNALSLFLPTSYKIVSVEDTREINLPHENWIAGTTRTGFSSSEANKTGKDIDMFDLVRIALRQRPKAIIVGEIRGREAYTLFQAMTTGHLSYSTIHASNLHALIQRLENPPISLPRVLLTSLDLVVFLNSVTVEGDPARRVTNVTEIIKLDPESNRLVTITPFSWVSEVEDRFEYGGGSRILNRIRMQHGWDEEKLNQELSNRMVVLEWMKRKNLRSYKQVGKIISEYHKNPKAVLKKVKEDDS